MHGSNRGIASVGSIGGDAVAPREMTLNERLNGVCANLHFECERIESVLSRVNGTPQTGAQNAAKADPAVHPMTEIVAMIENAAGRLQSLATNLQSIA